MADVDFYDKLKGSLTQEELVKIIAEHPIGLRPAPKKQAPAKRAAAKPAAKGAEKPKGAEKYWTRVQNELYCLLCTNDKKYAKVRKAVSSGSHSQTAIVVAISSAIGAVIGVAATVIMPLVAIALMTILSVARNVYCAGREC
jgi:VIT1/CCC1 family predicted Fe2+/Mn2+ transporter